MFLFVSGAALAAVAACEAGNTESELATASATASDGGGGNFTTTSVGGSDGGNGPSSTIATVTSGGDCDPGNDFDGDGYTVAEGDCNDCDPNVSPNAIEAPTEEGDPVDEDCDGETDEDDSVQCDENIPIDTSLPLVAARSLELCKLSEGDDDWGLVSAQWVLPDGSAPPQAFSNEYSLGHGVLPNFGFNVTPRMGESMLALSSGAARDESQPGYHYPSSYVKGYSSPHPDGFPQESPSCPGVITGEPHDGAGLELVINTPSNGYGIAFDIYFFTYEWPVFVCDQYNDFFVALLSPQLDANAPNENISFDSLGNPISVNNALLDVCGCSGGPPCMAGGKSFDCALGTDDLLGTGFDLDSDTFGMQWHAGTGWLSTTAPVEPSSEIRLRFGVYDSADSALDSTTLVDNFRWVLEPGTENVTVPVPD